MGRSVVEDIVTVGGVVVRMRLAAITGQNKFFDTNHGTATAAPLP